MAFDPSEHAGHLAEIVGQWRQALRANRLDAAVVPAGAASYYYQDDQSAPFHPNPHFARFFPDDNCEHSVLLVGPNERPKLYFHQPNDYWYQPPEVPRWAGSAFDIEVHADAETLTQSLVQDVRKVGRAAWVGPEAPFSSNLPLADLNPERLVNKLVFARATKTPFEVDRMREATAVAVRGHLAARDAFLGGGSEFDIHIAYLSASGQQESKLPYPNIIALNEHAGILHYQHYDRMRPVGTRSFLIDAGGCAHGYQADITRTYRGNAGDDFAALIACLDQRQRQITAEIRPGLSYVDLHARMHELTADVLIETGLVRCSAESAFEQRITDAFFPHGLGHLLGLQTHDVGGHLANADGETEPAPDRFPTLRYTRRIEPGHVFTVEPGVYFIPQLLGALAESTAGDDVNWRRVDALRACGGVRIEDNVLVTADGVQNLTRPAFAELDAVPVK